MDQYQEYMRMAGVPSMYYPMMQMPATQLESMYPKCYYVLYPRVKRMCDMYFGRYGNMVPTHEMMQQMTNSIYDEVEPMMQDDDMDEMGIQTMPIREQGSSEMEQTGYEDMESRQFDPGMFGGFRPRRRFLRDLIGILFITELLGRRRRPHHFGF
jgi:hypothetical protein